MNIFLIIQIIAVVGLIITILMQKSSADGFTGGGSGGGGGGNSLFSSRGKANALTRATAILATIFIINSMALAYIASHSEQNSSQIDKFTSEELNTPSAVEKEALESETAEPTVPMAE